MTITPRLDERQRPAAGKNGPEMSWQVPLSDLLVDDEIETVVRNVVRSGWWSMGAGVAAFEDEFADFCGAKTALAVTNGTAALHLALLAVGVGPEDEVIVPSLNFVAAANVIGHTGATPVFCDIRGGEDLNMDPEDVEAAVTPRTRAIIVLHYGGHPCDMEAILEVAARHDLAVVEDAAHAPGARWRDQMCGTIGNVGCFSFFSNKNLPTGEGGMLVTDDGDLADRIRRLRSHGMTTLTWDRHRGHASSYDVVAQGFNYRLDEMRAAIGRVELGRLRERNAARARIVNRYRAELHGVRGVQMAFASADGNSSAHHLAVLLLPEGHDRDAFRGFLTSRGIQTSVHYPPIHTFSYYRTLGARRKLPATDAVADRIVTLPLYPHMTDRDIAAVTECVLRAITR